jgi:hypothetical protein
MMYALKAPGPLEESTVRGAKDSSSALLEAEVAYIDDEAAAGLDAFSV